MEVIKNAVTEACKNLFNITVEPVLTRPSEQFGDFATNVALQISKGLDQNPRETAGQLAEAMTDILGDKATEVSVAGPGFINIRLSDKELWNLRDRLPQQTLKGQVVVTEYSDPNPFKVLHAGHLYTSVVGDAISELLEVAGAEVHRVNFGGDVGLHVGKTLWVIINRLDGENPEKLADVTPAERSEWMASAYVEGTNAYEDDETAKQQIIDLNKRIYQIHAGNDHESPLAQIYWTCRQWSYDYFDEFYARIGTDFERYYPESETAGIGLTTVKEHVGDVFVESDGAIVFKGEAHGLHTRVFINREGLPTYEAKDVGLIMRKKEDYDFDKSVVITGNEQEQYMSVVLKAVEQFAPELAAATTHLTHGIVKLQGGQKMSSRKGNILRAVDVIDAATKASKAATDNDDEQVVLAAIKYSFLKQRLGPDIIYDPTESVSLLGNSGPYLQYAHARARSILAKAGKQGVVGGKLDANERSLLRKLSEYSEVIDAAVNDLLPSHVCTYLYELSQVFNSFYEHNRVLDDPREEIRLALVAAYADTLKNGLNLLNIAAPDRL